MRSLAEADLEVQNKHPPLDIKRLLKENQSKIWIDLNPSSDYALSHQQVPLKQLIDQYQLIKKTDPQQNLTRRRLLKKIIQATRQSLIQDSNNDTLKLILQTALHKSQYLFKLSQLRQETFNRAFQLPSKKNVVRGIIAKYTSENLLHLDPAGRDRSLYPFYNEWQHALHQAEKQGSDPIPDFFYWLEDQSAPFEESFDLKSSHYRFPESRKVKFHKNGQSYSDRFGDPIQEFVPTERSRDNTYIYVIDQKGDLYLEIEGYHSDIKRGENVLAAGQIYFKDGKIIQIDGSSGHYQPKKYHLDYALEKLRKTHGSNIFHHDFKLIYFHENHNKTKNLREEDLINLLSVWHQLSEQQKNKQVLVENQDILEKPTQLSLKDLLKMIAQDQFTQNKNFEDKNCMQKDIEHIKEPSLVTDFILNSSLEETLNLLLKKKKAEEALLHYDQHLRLSDQDKKKFLKSYLHKKLLPQVSRLEIKMDQIKFQILEALNKKD